MPPPSYTLWGSELSPFTLKADAMCRYAGVAYRRLPAGAGIFERGRTQRRIDAIRAGRLPISFPEMREGDELPLVPFLLRDDGVNLYDSTAMAEWLDRHHIAEPGRLYPVDPLLHCAARLIDEYFDEFGLYMAHHNRWVVSARDNNAGRRVAREFLPSALAPLRPAFAAWFSNRQVRRLPYLFSVADPHTRFADLPTRRRPPALPEFPSTHELLDHCFLRMLERMELVLSDQPYLLGGRFTVADASAYGQLAMNFEDPSACRLIELRAPLTYSWLRSIEAGKHSREAENGRPKIPLEVSPRLGYLLEEIAQTFVPLMEQNEVAYERLRSEGVRAFNEPAFDERKALFDGEIRGTPFRSVVKTFQVNVWRRLRREWNALDPTAKAALPISASAQNARRSA